ncbi:hypothetical protein [Aquimarina sp. 2201CG14-23]|uniref:hypothetical protein n=1 Tax=Aquimarina mycalae TaxID=3040073 RepID=UPI0024780D1F|nr:hypothetical protein [Aquimarina sp. 2201CG14-23]MDH7445743.1 hypothetical protein [Aquimarina sp. 2201CG14-23]
MKYFLLYISVVLITLSCKTKNNRLEYVDRFLTHEIPVNEPMEFKSDLIPKDFLVHRGVFSNDFEEYYYTISDTSFSSFDVKYIKKHNGKWSAPEDAFFNSEFNEHGMSFSPNGNILVFSSTRPVDSNHVSNTWHIWKSEKINGTWSTPEYVDIPNLRDKLVSHPSLTKDGTIYFHSSDIDYTNMEIYYSNQIQGKYQQAKKVNFSGVDTNEYCTPYISSNEDYLIFASINEYLDLHISYRTSADNWSSPIKLPSFINVKGKGNPYITPDEAFLFYCEENESSGTGWKINWVSTKLFKLSNEK